MHRIRMPLYAPVTAHANMRNFLSCHSATASGSASGELILFIRVSPPLSPQEDKITHHFFTLR
jgi:hypothetical protein